MSKPFALIRFSGESESHFYTGFDVPYPTNLSTNKKHFVLHAFDDDLTPNLAFEIEHDLPAPQALPYLQFLNEFGENAHHFYSKDEYQNLVENAVKEIKKDLFKKVVHARSIITAKPFDLLQKFHELALNQPLNTVFLIYFPGKTCWLGSTPELLASWKEENGKTVALAGTSLISESPTPGKKELDEQQIIISYFKDVFEQQQIKSYKINPPEVLNVGEIAHWQSKIEFTCSEDKILKLINEIHPTPAVGGFPKIPALNYLKQTEKTNREYYSGFFGIVGQSEIKLYVNIRCMNIFRNEAVAFAGGGITLESNAVKEWDETIWKLNVI